MLVLTLSSMQIFLSFEEIGTQAVFQELMLECEELSEVLSGVPAELYTTPWFIAAFANTFPVETRLRLWDVFLLNGVSFIHQVRRMVGP